MISLTTTDINIRIAVSLHVTSFYSSPHIIVAYVFNFSLNETSECPKGT